MDTTESRSLVEEIHKARQDGELGPFSAGDREQPMTTGTTKARRERRLRLLVALYETGVTAREVANRFGITKQRVLQLLRTAHVRRPYDNSPKKRPPRGLKPGQNIRVRPMSPQHKERLRLVIYLYRSGASAFEVGQAVGIAKQRVLQLLRAAGVPRRQCGNVRRGPGGRYCGISAA